MVPPPQNPPQNRPQDFAPSLASAAPQQMEQMQMRPPMPLPMPVPMRAAASRCDDEALPMPLPMPLPMRAAASRRAVVLAEHPPDPPQSEGTDAGLPPDPLLEPLSPPQLSTIAWSRGA